MSNHRREATPNGVPLMFKCKLGCGNIVHDPDTHAAFFHPDQRPPSRNIRHGHTPDDPEYRKIWNNHFDKWYEWYTASFVEVRL